MADRSTDRDCAADVASDSGVTSIMSELSAQIWDGLRSKAQSVGNQASDWSEKFSDATNTWSVKSAGEFIFDADLTAIEYVINPETRTEINEYLDQTVSDVGQGMASRADFVVGTVKDYTVDSSIARSLKAWNDSTKEWEWVKQVNSFIQRGGQFARDLL